MAQSSQGIEKELAKATDASARLPCLASSSKGRVWTASITSAQPPASSSAP